MKIQLVFSISLDTRYFCSSYRGPVVHANVAYPIKVGEFLKYIFFYIGQTCHLCEQKKCITSPNVMIRADLNPRPHPM